MLRIITLWAMLNATFWTLPTGVGQAVANPGLHVVEIGETIDGEGVSVFINRWWQWRFLFPQNLNPVGDMTGRLCAMKQEGKVWFLADAPDQAPVMRTCRIPSDRHILFPILSNIIFSPPGVEQSCDDVMRQAAFERNPNYKIEVSLDGVKIENAERFLRASDGCFDVNGRLSKSQEAASFAPSAADGYWLMLKPLPPGNYHLRFKAIYQKPDTSSANVLLDVSYNLEITED